MRCALATFSLAAADTAFVHLFEWGWSDVANECEKVLGPKGYDAVQVSPPMEHITGDQWWTRYQPVSYKLTSRSGDESAFEDMVKRCNSAGVRVVVDAVINHMASGGGTGIAGSTFGDRAFPAAGYTQDNFHHNGGDKDSNCAVTDYSNKDNVQLCDLSGLTDLCTGCDDTKNKLIAYLKNLKSKGSNVGFRIDAAKHQDAGELGAVLYSNKDNVQLCDLSGLTDLCTGCDDTKNKLIAYLKNLKSKGSNIGFRIDAAKHQDAGELGAVLSGAGSTWNFQEVISGSGEAVSPEMYLNNGHVSEFNFARQLAPNFKDENKLCYLDSFGPSWGFIDTSKAVTFMDNHDTQRGEAILTYKDGDVYYLANVFMLATQYGYPKVMSSYAFDSHDQGPPSYPVSCGNDWICEHRRPEVANMVAWRKTAGDNAMKNFVKDGCNHIGFSRGSAFVALNRDGSGSWQTTVQTGMPAGTYCDVAQSDDPSSCPKVTVDSSGQASITVPGLKAVAFHAGVKAASEAQAVADIVV
eukprot:CAMPEP_0204506544 /NCGR_PEP_ID=MMETSP0471-20130131/109304_1 /ASSEMBLY_ACC=CAM_ASM_000602 /TAXON_ID=2969 /ORGANISM="Oxyrrhis marina" /LENGTH=522 /DNA_ID=CAMNT_0051511549 /DNA_START=42 /DNA_END=1610 /DNA_ORIENTATION=+